MSLELQRKLKSVIMKHLSRLKAYEPAHRRGKGKLSVEKLKESFAADPVFSIFGLDSPEYIAASLAGGTITSIHRKIGDAYQECVQTIFLTRYYLTKDKIRYTGEVLSGDRRIKRSLDAYFVLKDIPLNLKKKWASFAKEKLKKISAKPKIKIEAIGFEVRHCYQSADSKRVQADEAIARHCIVSGILPVMLIFCKQSNRSVVNRYRSLWIVTEGRESYDLLREKAGFDFYSFLLANKETFRQPVIRMLRKLREE